MTKKKYFYDTEFIEDGETIDLISIGIICEDGREYYAINYDCNFNKASDWVKQNVLAYLPEKPFPKFYSNLGEYEQSESYRQGWRNKLAIAMELKEFFQWSPKKPYFEEGCKPELWAYYGAYDHVVLCQIFGKMIDLPKGFPMHTNDIKQLCNSRGNPELPKNRSIAQHHALNDARMVKDMWNFLQ